MIGGDRQFLNYVLKWVDKREKGLRNGRTCKVESRLLPKLCDREMCK